MKSAKSLPGIAGRIGAADAKHTGKITIFPDGSYDLIAANKPVFGPKGVERMDTRGAHLGPLAPPVGVPMDSSFIGPLPLPAARINEARRADPNAAAEDLERARTRARAAVRRLALCNDFRWFVTLTIDPAKIDSKDSVMVVRRLSQWCSNQVKRRGLRYVLVPERHKKGGIHFHGFFSDCMEAVDSGHKDKNGHIKYNLPGWGYGFTTAIELYGDYHAAVAYTCKYIGKDCEKIGGRWYYSGGDLRKPVEKYVDLDSSDLVENFEEETDEKKHKGVWIKTTPGGVFAGIAGLKGEPGAPPAQTRPRGDEP